MKRVVIVGAGVSGVYLSILLKKKIHDLEVIVLEQNVAALKKLLATGNGRCNLSHRDIDKCCYQSDDEQLVEHIVKGFDMPSQMRELGLCCVYHGDLLYPRSEQALSVKNILMQRAREWGVSFCYEQEVCQIQKKDVYHIMTNQQCLKSDYVVWAMGSEAGKLSGQKTLRYDLLKSLQLKLVEPIPSLVQFYTQPVMKKWKGVRVKGTFRLMENQVCIHQEKGELLFTDYGVSGIAVMQLSAFYQNGHNYELLIDFLDEMSEEDIVHFLSYQKQQGYHHIYDGLLHEKIAVYFEKNTRLSLKQQAHLLKNFSLSLLGLREAQYAQVMRGGLSLQEVHHDLEIKKYPHMYAVGEILNVAGLCGGYNLHFAFASAYCVACAIERSMYAKNS